MMIKFSILLFTAILLEVCGVSAQISPGELSKAHAELEGVSNCTKCHDLGNKVTRKKCLECHQAIKSLIDAKKGYHASAEVSSKDCYVCHNDHHGRNFQMLKFDKSNFDHGKSGFELKGSHTKEDCKACHKPSFIKDPEVRKNTSTYLGLNKECLSCHDDFHKGRMSPNCTTCHGFDTFKKAAGFDHNTTKYPLIGKHKTVVCEKCHKPAIENGKPVQRWERIGFENCTNCHKDVHENKFGQNCVKCHTEESFHTIKQSGSFDHDKTDFRLIGKHQSVECKKCHKTNLVDPIRYDHCYNCHFDYHKNEFTKNGIQPDCNLCHNLNSFSASLFTIEMHNLSSFRLDGAHLATPCYICHKKEERWTFVRLGKLCVDCHLNKHKGFIQEKYYPGESCTACHNVSNWKIITFDHSITRFKLEGAHSKYSCAGCHMAKKENGLIIQKFEGLSDVCSNCHKDTHAGQFDVNGITDCKKCHRPDDWKNTIFVHNSSKFKLDGAHIKVRCERCHKEVVRADRKYIEYKNNKLLCSDCHR
jgi:hypothetical protein